MDLILSLQFPYMFKKTIVALSIALLAIGLFGWQNVIELRAEEPRRGVVSIEMLLSGNYVVPQINGWSYYNKPPVFNWLMVGCFKLFNSMDEWVVRLPSLLSFVALGWFCFRFFGKYVTKEVALLSALFFVTSADLLLYGTVNSGEIDIFYALVVFLQAFALFHFHQKSDYWKLFLISYLLVGIGFLTKGLPSLAFQALTLIGMAIYHRDFKLIISWQHISGIILLIAILSGYFGLYAQQDDAIGFLVRQFKEAAQRTGLETEASDTLVQTITFPLQIIKLLLPWSLLVVFFFSRGFIKAVKSNNLLAFSALFVVVNIPIYWFSGDFKARYLYMFLPFLALLLAHFYIINKDTMIRIRKMIFGIFGGLSVLLPIGFIALFFVPEVMALSMAAIRIVTMIILLGAVSIIYFKSQHKIYVVVLLLAVARIGFNLIYLPALAADENASYYRNATSQILEITRDEPIYLIGQPHVFSSDASIGPITFEESVLTTAPLIAYQIPYYLSKNNGHIVKFVERPMPGKFHLVPAEIPQVKKVVPLSKIRDNWQERDYVLVRL